MKGIMTICVLCNLLLLTGLMARADATRSVDDYTTFLTEKTAELEAELDAELAPQLAEIERLAKPIAIGDEVTLTLSQWGRQTAISGTLRRIGTTEVRLDDTNYALADIGPLDRLRLKAAKLPPTERHDFLQEWVTKRRAAVMDQRDKELAVRLARAKLVAGYDTRFFAETHRLGGTFWPRKSLGEGTMGATLILDQSLSLAEMRLRDSSGEPSLIVVFIGQQPVFSNLPDGFAPGLVTPDWQQQSFLLLANQAHKLATTPQQLRLRVYRHDVGAWWLAGTSSARDGKMFRDSQRRCRECFGEGKVTTEAGTATCEACAGEGDVDGERALLVQPWTFRLVEETSSEDAEAVAEDVMKLARQAEVYQAQIRRHRETLQRQARHERLEQAREAAAEKAARAEQARQAQMQQTWQQALLDNYLWTRAGQPSPPAMLERYASDYTFDNENTPRQISRDGKIWYVRQFTDWQVISDRMEDLDRDLGVRLYGPAWRLLWLQAEEEGAAPSFFLQSAVQVDTTSRRAGRLSLKLTTSVPLTDETSKAATLTWIFSPVQIMQAGCLLPLTLEEAAMVRQVNLSAGTL